MCLIKYRLHIENKEKSWMKIWKFRIFSCDNSYKTMMTIEDHTSKTKTGSRPNKDSPCDPETPVSIAPHSDCSFQKARSDRKSSVLPCLGVRKNTPAAVVLQTSVCTTQQPRTWLQSEGKTTLWRNMRAKGKDSNKDNPSSVNTPLPAVWSGHSPRRCYSCTAAAWEANNQHSTHLQGTEHTAQAALEHEPSAALCHPSGERTIVQEHHLGKKENSTDPAVGRSEGISFAEADGALRSFLATCFPSSERNQ